MAAQSHDPHAKAIMRSLIRAGADVDTGDFWHRTPLIYAAAEQDFDDATFLEPLLESGRANIDAQDCRERTTLGYAALMGCPKTVKRLLDAGADPTIPANWGYTPVVEALVANHSAAVQTLLEFHHRNDIPIQVRHGKPVEIIGNRTLLHLLAEHGDARILRLFKQYVRDIDSAMVDPKAESKEGVPADDVFKVKTNVDKDTRMAWEELFGTIEGYYMCDVKDTQTDDSDSDGEFEDAKSSW
ncbi:ankyrin [Lentithecium fluviatile CBS 122367]|uniref:Ankyrin n=1 Tax=Lentithecium fluviatile CBS 122367 TaxID=1168545 RepID=A0A6G1IH30_9PLEO|nr:ankyrin [Lentithecium fluviatile CBS 122367]